MNVKKYFFLLLLIIGSATRVYCQLDEPDNAKWKFSLSKTDIKPGDVIELIFTADVSAGWALYSSDFKADIGPLPTEFAFTPDGSYKLVGNIVPQNPSKKKDKTWDVDYTYFNNKAVFKQKVKIIQRQYKIVGTIKGLTCSELNGLCVPFSTTFKF